MTVFPFGPVRYFHGQNLDLDAFVDEQRYHEAMQRRHNIGQHGWGIVAGLEVRLVAPPQAGGTWSVELAPGYAVDGYGRELVVGNIRTVPVDLAGARAAKVERLEVRLNYEIQPVGGTGTGGSDARWNLSPTVLVGAAAALLPAPFAPQDPPPWGNDWPWPVPLATILVDGDADGRPALVVGSGRRYAGLVGQEVRPPTGSARLTFGDDDAEIPHRFAIRIEPDAGAATAPHAPPGAVLWIDTDGGLHAETELELGGDLRLAGDLRFTAETASPPVPADRTAWRVYRHRATDSPVGELRIEMPPIVGTAIPAQLVIGAWSDADKAVMPALTVSADGTVTVAGNLKVGGLVNPPVPAAGSGTPAGEMVQAARLSALSAAAAANADKLTQQANQGLIAAIVEAVRKLLASQGIGR